MVRRKKHSALEKVSILKQHFLERKAVSDLCDKYGIHPTQFYRWQKQFFENASVIFEKNDKQDRKLEKKIRKLENKLVQKNEVLAELMEEHVTLKKSLGED